MSASSSFTMDEWTGDSPPSEAEIMQMLSEQGLSGYRWSNSPGDVYGAHSHSFHKIIYVLQGSTTFVLPLAGEQITLNPGDRLNLLPDTLHEAVVGPQGVICLEAHRRT